MNDSHHLIVIFVINFMVALCSLVLKVSANIKHYDYATLEFNLVLNTLMGYSTIQLFYMVGIMIYEGCVGTNGTVRNRNQVSIPSSRLTGYSNPHWP